MAIAICVVLVLGVFGALRPPTAGNTVLKAASTPTYYDWAGWDGNRSMYLTDYTGDTYLPSTFNSSFAYQTMSNSSFQMSGAGLANAETVSVNTGTGPLYPAVSPPYSYYTYTSANGWELVMNVTDSGTATPWESYNGGWFWVYAGFEDLIATLSDGPTSGEVQTTIVTSYDDGINVSNSGSGIVTSGSAGADWGSLAISVGIIALELGVAAATDGSDLELLPAGAEAVYAAYHIASESGEYDTSALTSNTNYGTPNATVNQWGEITDPVAGDYEFSQATRLMITIAPQVGGNGQLPILGYGDASLLLSAFPLLGDNQSGPSQGFEYTEAGATPTLSYAIFPAVSIQGNVTQYPGTPASGATVLLQADCPNGPLTGTTDYYETTNSAGQWHFFASPNCSYTYTASAKDSAQSQTLTSAPRTFSLASGAAGTNVWLAPLPIGQQVTFSESGVPTGDTWSVAMNGATLSAAAGTNIVFVEPNGNYTYSVTVPSGYLATPSSGTVWVNGAAMTESTTVTHPTYTVSFDESGLPSGDSWSVTLNSVSSGSTTSATISFTEYSGTYSYSVSPPSGYSASPSSGSVAVSANVKVAVTIAQIVTYSVTFKESGLPSGDTWDASVNGAEDTATAPSSITFSGLSGSNSYTVGEVIVLDNGCVVEYYSPSPASGTVTGATTISVTYTYHVVTEVSIDKCVAGPASAGPQSSASARGAALGMPLATAAVAAVSPGRN